MNPFDQFDSLQSNQAPGQPTANAEAQAPNPFDQFDNNQSSGLFEDKPGMTYGNILPFARNEKTGETSLAMPEIMRSFGRGVVGMAQDISGRGQQVGSNLNQDEIGALGMISPTTAGAKNIPQYAASSTESAARGIAPIVKPIANQLNPMPLARDIAMIPKGVGSVAGDAEKLGEASDVMHDIATPYYSEMRKLGDALKPQATSGLMEAIDNNLSKMENEYIPELNPKTTAIINAMRAKADSGMLGVSKIDQYRRLLSRVGSSEDGFSAGIARNAIDQTLNSLEGKDLVNGNTKSIDLLNQARGASAKAFRYEAVADVLKKANGDPNKIKSGLTRFVNSDDFNKYNAQEQAALRNAADTGIVGNIVKGFGKLGIDFSKSGTGNTVLPYLTAFAKTGGASLIPGGLPMVAAATIARQGQKYAVRGAAQRALDVISSRDNALQKRNLQ